MNKPLNTNNNHNEEVEDRPSRRRPNGSGNGFGGSDRPRSGNANSFGGVVDRPDRNGNGFNGQFTTDPIIKKLLYILHNPNKHFNLTIHSQGFIQVDELFKIPCNEFLKFTTKKLIKYIQENNTNNIEKKPTFILRRNPDKPTEYEIRTMKKPKYDFPVENFADGGEPFKQNKLTSTLNYILRHNEETSEIRNEFGYLPIDWIMQQGNMKPFTEEQVMELIGNEKGLYRYETRINPITQQQEVRSLFGQNNENTLMTEHSRIWDITTALYESPTVVYGTTFEEWEIIKDVGISRTSLGHIHFAAYQDVLLRFRYVFYSDYNIVDVVIHINIEKAMKDGWEFFTSFNGLILCRCDAESRLSPKYFEKAISLDAAEGAEEYDLITGSYY